MLSAAALSFAIVVLAFASQVNAHGALKVPEPTFEDGGANNNWVTEVNNYWDIGSGGDQVGKFKTMAAEKGMSVKDVVLDMVKDKNGNNGFTHVGPCEAYIDDKMVLHGDDCEAEYPGGEDGSGKMSEMTIDYSSCNGDCMLTFYWLGFQNERWQTYVNCVPLTGSGQSTGGQSNGNQTTTEAPSSDTKETEAPSSENEERTNVGLSFKDVPSPGGAATVREDSFGFDD
ncbi:hypothetical protein PHYBOEH_011832 [Phytophthora boehmeriae]|uniref:Uncharacterized protein n=1 Tax=Phytophthora boehmeriae TaxID=109152 RepID=A0A8T1X2S1_9STRA|nr:hypothetical protein PHYBOEH_011832 [Phytophthora boehmeriae]